MTQKTKSPKGQNHPKTISPIFIYEDKITHLEITQKIEIMESMLQAGHDQLHSWVWGWLSGRGGPRVATSTCATGATWIGQRCGAALCTSPGALPPGQAQAIIREPNWHTHQTDLARSKAILNPYQVFFIFLAAFGGRWGHQYIKPFPRGASGF